MVAATTVRWRDRDDLKVVDDRPRGVQEPEVVIHADAPRLRTGLERGPKLAQILNTHRAHRAAGLDQKPADHPLGCSRADMLGEPGLGGGLLEGGQVVLEPAAVGEFEQA